MHSKTEGNWLLDSYFPPKKGSCTRLVSGENCSPHTHLKATLIIWKHQHQEEKKTRSEVGSWPRCQPRPVWSFLTFIVGLLDSYMWIKKKKKIVFYHWHGVIQILEITQIFVFVVNYLYPVLLVYLDGFLPSKVLFGWLLESLFCKEGIIFLSGLLLISLDGTHSLGQSNMLILTLAINMNFPLRLLELKKGNRLNPRC